MEQVAPYFERALKEYSDDSVYDGFSSEMRNDHVIPMELMQ